MSRTRTTAPTSSHAPAGAAPTTRPPRPFPFRVLPALVGARLTPEHLLQLQRTVGNRAVGQLLAAAHGRPPAAELRREEEPSGPAPQAEAEAPMTEAEGELFEQVLGELSDEELDLAFEALAEEEEGESAEAEKHGAPAAEAAAPSGEPSIQRAKSLLAGNNPDIPLANLLEGNNSKRPRLVPMSRWNRIKKKHVARGFRKYAAIRHQNLTNNAGTEDLVLLVRLRRRVAIGHLRDRHYAAIEAKSRKRRQTAQNRTELLGEVAATIRMEGYLGGDAELLIGYVSGAGIDQLWVSQNQQKYYVVEAKGPGAKLKVNPFAVRGALKGAALVQMSNAWVADRIPRLAAGHAAVLNNLLRDCGLRVVNGALRNDPARAPTHTIHGLVITAKWNEATGEVGTGLSTQQYQF